MGTKLLDQYSFLHFSVGVIAYFWGVPFWLWNFLHISFEILENTELGMSIINKYIYLWPGGKGEADSWINNLGDVLSGTLGWLAAYLLDFYGNKKGWYGRHINR